MKPIEISYYILQHYNNITPMKLQKLLYYVKVWGLVSGNQLVDGIFKKWRFGPVNEEVYQTFKMYGNTQIPHHGTENVEIPGSEKELVDLILDSYAPYDAITLSAMTHQDEPWLKTPINAVITDKAIVKYYSKLPFAKNFPFDSKKPFYPIQSDMHYAYIFDMSKQDAEAASVFHSYGKYKEYIFNAQKNLSALLSNSLA